MILSIKTKLQTYWTKNFDNLRVNARHCIWQSQSVCTYKYCIPEKKNNLQFKNLVDSRYKVLIISHLY